jgi:hypothetical protein
MSDGLWGGAMVQSDCKGKQTHDCVSPFCDTKRGAVPWAMLMHGATIGVRASRAFAAIAIYF